MRLAADGIGKVASADGTEEEEEVEEVEDNEPSCGTATLRPPDTDAAADATGSCPSALSSARSITCMRAKRAASEPEPAAPLLPVPAAPPVPSAAAAKDAELAAVEKCTPADGALTDLVDGAAGAAERGCCGAGAGAGAESDPGGAAGLPLEPAGARADTDAAAFTAAMADATSTGSSESP